MHRLTMRDTAFTLINSLIEYVMRSRQRRNENSFGIKFVQARHAVPVVEMAQFSNVIVTGTINSAQGDLHINNRYSEVGLHTLELGVSLGAIHDSAARYPAPNCHRDTRMAVRKIILDWIHDESSVSPFFWLYGPAGAGKTAILQAIAEFLCSPSGSNENFGGSFFFSRGTSGRDQGHFLFSTIAYQLALKVPGLRGHVNRIMEENPALHTKSMDVQLQTLIINAFRSLSPFPQHSYLVIIDGLDECHDKAIQQSILQLLCDSTALHKLPLRFLIGSRPEFHIRASFDQESLRSITQRVVLDETFNPGRDIQKFLRDGFAKIYAKNADILAHVNQPWPGEGVIDLLVQRSSGQFIYPATVLKFVGADLCNPMKQLTLVLKPDPTAFSDLDRLYTQILLACPTTVAVNIVQALGTIMAFSTRTLTPEVIGDILEIEEGDLKLVLRCLSSLIAFVGAQDKEYQKETIGSVYFTHASFRDYLVDPSRSGPFHVNELEYKKQATMRCFSLIFKSTVRSWGIPSNRILHKETWQYFKIYLADRCISSSKAVKDAIMAGIHDLVQEFCDISRSKAVDVSLPAMCCLVTIFTPKTFSGNPGPTTIVWNDVAGALDTTKPEHVRIIDGFPKMLDQSLRTFGSELTDLVRFIPGIVVQKPLTMQAMAILYRVNMGELERHIKSNINLLLPFHVGRRSHYKMGDYLASFLLDPGRSQIYYCDPMLHHISICCRLFSLMDRLGSKPLDSHLSYHFTRYVDSNLYDHLVAATEIFLSNQNVPADHPAVKILDNLESIAYHNALATQSSVDGYLVRRCIFGILRWAAMLISRLNSKGIVLFSNVDLIRRVCQLTYKIYGEILCLKMDGGTMIVALVGHTFGVTSSFYVDRKALRHWAVIQLSWELLSFVSEKGGIFPSFTQFITTPKISEALYISPHVFHTQITEYFLETIYQSEHFQGSPFTRSLGGSILHCSFEKHISQALPTEVILYLLRSIPSWRFTYKRESSIIDVLEIIIRWLEVIGLESERPTDLYDRFRAELASRRRIA